MQYFEALLNRIYSILDQDPNKLTGPIYRKAKVKNYIIKLNTGDNRIAGANVNGQLYDKGIDASGRSLKSIGGDYSAFTKSLKAAANLPTNRITLFDTGDFYRSFKVVPATDGFIIQANTIKDQDDLRVRWGDNILGLTDESKTKLVEYIIEDFITEVNKGIA